MKAGVSKVNITPPIGVELSGFVARQQPSTGIHDDLYAKALVFDDGNDRTALVCCDIVGLSRESVSKIRQLVQKSSGISPKNVMIACTHTHSGPATLWLRNCGDMDNAWMDILYRYIAGAVTIACNNLEDARIGFGAGTVHLGIDRRAGLHPDAEEPGIADSDALLGKESSIVKKKPRWADPELAVLKVEGMDGRLIGALLNYSCHPVVMASQNRHISADYPGVATRFVERSFGENAVALFANKACGDANPVVTGGTFSDLERLGTMLGAEAVQVLTSISGEPAGTISVASKEITLSYNHFELDYVRSEKETWKKKLSEIKEPGPEERSTRAMVWWAEDTLRMLESGKAPASFETEIQAIKIGPAILAGVGGELFSEIGRILRQKCGPETFILGYTNDMIGYIPTAEAFGEGGYEPSGAYRYYGTFPFAPNVGTIVEKEIVNIVNQVK